jgi:hypothetical protein
MKHTPEPTEYLYRGHYVQRVNAEWRVYDSRPCVDWIMRGTLDECLAAIDDVVDEQEADG